MIVETSREDFASLLRGRAPRAFSLPDPDFIAADILTMLADLDLRLRPHITPASWLMVEGDEIVGLCSIKAPPAAGAIDIGYGVAERWWGRGIATRAVAGVVAWAESRTDLVAVTAETLPDGWASQRVLTRNGFAQVGERIDEEDGRVFCWRRGVG